MTGVQTVIGIAGASGSGKSTFAGQLVDLICESTAPANVSILNEDRYYRDRSDLNFSEREQINYDHPDALEHDLLAAHLQDLRAGKTIQAPCYNYAEHSRDEDTEMLKPGKILILEGILILHRPEIRNQLDLALFIDLPLDVCLARRLQRDTGERGRSMESVLRQFTTSVRPMFFEYILPTKDHADIIVPQGGQNAKALNLLHSHVKDLLGQ